MTHLATERALEIFTILVWNVPATWLLLVACRGDQTLHLADCSSRAIVGKQIPVIHSQIGASEPRNIRPELACSGSPLTSSGSRA